MHALRKRSLDCFVDAGGGVVVFVPGGGGGAVSGCGDVGKVTRADAVSYLLSIRERERQRTHTNSYDNHSSSAASSPFCKPTNQPVSQPHQEQIHTHGD